MTERELCPLRNSLRKASALSLNWGIRGTKTHQYISKAWKIVATTATSAGNLLALMSEMPLLHSPYPAAATASQPCKGSKVQMVRAQVDA